MSILWINGQLIDKADAKVSPFDHGFLYGDGVWEHLRIFGGKLSRPDQHLQHLSAAADALGIDIPLSRAELTAAVDATVKANDRTEGYIRVIVTRGPGTIGPDPRKIDPQVIVTAEEYQPFPQELYGHGLHAAVFPVPLDTDHPAQRVRALGRPHTALAKRHALRHGCLEAFLVNRADNLVGATEGAIFLWKGGSLLRPARALPDATGAVVAELAREDLFVVETALAPADLTAADEVFIAGTACGVIGVVRVDGQDIGGGIEGAITKQIREQYAALTRGGA